jgi:hypothetical protein
MPEPAALVAHRPENDKGVADPPEPPTTSHQPSAPLGGNNLTRVTVNLAPRAMAALERLSTAKGATKTDLINRGLQVLELVEQLMDQDGGSLTILHKDGTTERLIII